MFGLRAVMSASTAGEHSQGGISNQQHSLSNVNLDFEGLPIAS